MLISYSHRFIFIHVYKVAGVSIRDALRTYTTQRPWYQPLMKKIGRPSPDNFLAHATANEIKHRLPKHIYNNFFKFAFVRNPWDWQVSLFVYMLEKKDHFQHDLIKSMLSFDEYIEWRISKDKHLQKDFVTDTDGSLIVDFIGKYETLDNDFVRVCNEIGIKANLPHLNKSSRVHYKEYYNEKTINLVYEAFKEDIEFFNYSF